MGANGYAARAVCSGGAVGAFVTTHWSQVLAAGETTSSLSAAALEQLCADYWYPLYVYVRSQGHPVEDAEDLTQAFFARFLERKYLRLADRTRGRFRTFLLTALKHFLINEWNKAHCDKRGAGCPLLSLDIEKSETRFQMEPADDRSPDRAFDRQWALVLLERVLGELEKESAANGRAGVFGVLKCFLTTEDSQSSYAEIGGRLGMAEATVKVTVHRLRRRYGELLRKEIARTLADPRAVEEELNELYAAVGG